MSERKNAGSEGRGRGRRNGNEQKREMQREVVWVGYGVLIRPLV